MGRGKDLSLEKINLIKNLLSVGSLTYKQIAERAAVGITSVYKI